MRGIRNSKKRNTVILACMILAVIFSGCGKKKDDLNQVEIIPYELMDYQTAKVMQGDITSSVDLTLKVEGVETILYMPEKENLKVDKIYVKEGDRVKKGDILLTFESKELTEKLKEYEEQYDQGKMLLEHYEKLSKIDKENDYIGIIADLKRDLEVTSMYIKEQEAKLSSYHVVADEDGTIGEVYEGLFYGYYDVEKFLIKEVCGSDSYVAETFDMYEFETGKIYQATAEVATYDMKLVKVSKAENKNGGEKQILTFAPVSDMSGVSEDTSLNMRIDKPTVKDAIYVDKRAIHRIKEDPYVYVMEEDGYRKAVHVKVGDVVDDQIIILDGLTKDQEVTID